MLVDIPFLLLVVYLSHDFSHVSFGISSCIMGNFDFMKTLVDEEELDEIK